MPDGSFCDGNSERNTTNKREVDFAESALKYPEDSGIRGFLEALGKAKPNESVLPNSTHGSSGWGFNGQK